MPDVDAVRGVPIPGYTKTSAGPSPFKIIADFFLLHAFGYSWYIFNIADVAIVAGVGVLLYESWAEDRPAAQR